MLFPSPCCPRTWWRGARTLLAVLKLQAYWQKLFSGLRRAAPGKFAFVSSVRRALGVYCATREAYSKAVYRASPCGSPIPGPEATGAPDTDGSAHDSQVDCGLRGLAEDASHN